MTTKVQVVEQLKEIEAKYNGLLIALNPSLDIYREIKDYKMAVHDLISEIEEGKYDKEPEIHWKERRR